MLTLEQLVQTILELPIDMGALVLVLAWSGQEVPPSDATIHPRLRAMFDAMESNDQFKAIWLKMVGG